MAVDTCPPHPRVLGLWPLLPRGRRAPQESPFLHSGHTQAPAPMGRQVGLERFSPPFTWVTAPGGL